MSRHRAWHLCNLLCRTYTLFRLVSIARYVFKALSIGSPGAKIKVFRENNACFESILRRRNRIFDLNCKHSVLPLNHEYHIYLRLPFFFQRLPWLYVEKAIRFARSITMFFTSIWSRACETETTITTGCNFLNVHS